MPMKVTVCFDRVRVIVPCGDGEIPVNSLIEKAIVRFRKATGKSSDYWVSVNNLRTTDGGILDPDDLLVDVIDDREQLVADYDEQGGNNYQPHNGDGASASSTGTASPEPADPRPAKTYHPVNEEDTVVVTPKDITSGSRLTVRRGSEPTLHVLNDNTSTSTAINRDHKNVFTEPNADGTLSLPRNAGHGSGGANQFSRFSRDSWRQSLGNRPDMYKWLVAQEKQQDRIQMERKEPVGGASTDMKTDVPDVINRTHQPHIQGSILINLPTTGGPLGIHVVPDYNEEGRENGLLVQGVESGGRVHQDGRLREHDRIIEINGLSLLNLNFKKAQEIFRDSMKAEEIKLRVVKKKPGPSLPKHPPPTLPKPKGYSPSKPSPLTLPIPKLDSPDSTGPEKTSTPADSGPSNPSSPLSPEAIKKKEETRDPQPIKPGPPIRPGLPNKPQSPTKKVPPAVPARDPKTSLSTQENAIIAPTNTKKIGKRIPIQLKKGASGLGFSVTTRDNPAGGFTPIYIKNILPKGAAIEEGTLKAGDRLLMVNGDDMDGKSQSEVVAILRNVKLGEAVDIEISRQVTEDDRFKVPRQLNIEKQNVLQPAEKTGDDGTLAMMKNKEIISLDIPLNDTGSAGLGVSVKGKTITIPEQGTRDLGIFIKAVISGGAASRDGRLAVNDQLLEVNGESLKDLSNSESMETLRKAMQKEGARPGHIHLVIARKIGAPSPSPFQESSTDYALYNQNKSSDYSESNDSKEVISPVPPDVTQNSFELKDYGVDKSRNFLIERLMKSGNGLRNESYTRATHDSFNDSGNVSSPDVSPIKPLQSAPTVHELLERNKRDSVLIEEDSQEQVTRMRPHSTLGILRHNSTNSSSSEDENQQPPWLQSQHWDRHPSTTSEELVSPMGDAATAFSREGFGRQSMSEKRRAHMDPSHSEVYQKIKQFRDSNRAQSGQKRVSSNIVRVGSMESLVSHGNRTRLPALPLQNVNKPSNDKEPKLPLKSNLKRFGSLENLATTGTVSDADDTIDGREVVESSPSPELPHMARGRKCNDSFRAAVDRSYDPANPPSTMETCKPSNDSDVDEEEDTLNTSGGFAVQGDVEEESSESNFPNSARSSVSSDQPEDHKKSKKKNPKDKKGGILKGIFKIGKNKKTEENSHVIEEDKDSLKEAGLQFKMREDAMRSHQLEQERAQEQYRRLQESSRPSEQYRLLQHYHGNQRSFDSDQSPPNNMTRAEWIQYLRMEHQRKHRERQGHYPHEDREEFHEKEIIQSLDKPHYHGDSAIHMYHQVQRPRPLSRQQFDRPDPYSVHPTYHYEPHEHQRYQRQPAVEIFHQRQSSDTLDNSYRDNFMRRMPSRSHTPIERYFDGELSYHEKPYKHEHSSGYYGDPIFAYRDPVYPSVAGKRPVQTISQSGSAKV